MYTGIILTAQSKLQRRESPYPSNCTNSWTDTPFSEIIRDFNSFEEEDQENKTRIDLSYNLAVRQL